MHARSTCCCTVLRPIERLQIRRLQPCARSIPFVLSPHAAYFSVPFPTVSSIFSPKAKTTLRTYPPSKARQLSRLASQLEIHRLCTFPRPVSTFVSSLGQSYLDVQSKRTSEQHCDRDSFLSISHLEGTWSWQARRRPVNAWIRLINRPCFQYISDTIEAASGNSARQCLQRKSRLGESRFFVAVAKEAGDYFAAPSHVCLFVFLSFERSRDAYAYVLLCLIADSTSRPGMRFTRGRVINNKHATRRKRSISRSITPWIPNDSRPDPVFDRYNASAIALFQISVSNSTSYLSQLFSFQLTRRSSRANRIDLFSFFAQPTGSLGIVLFFFLCFWFFPLFLFYAFVFFIIFVKFITTCTSFYTFFASLQRRFEI